MSSPTHPTLQFRGGLRIGFMNFTWPFAAMHISQQNILIKVFKTTYRFNKDQVIATKKYRGLFSKGIQITHTVNTVPESLIFWTFQQKSLLKHLIDYGYKTD